MCDSSLHFEDLRNPTNFPGLYIQFHRSDSTASSDRCPGCLVWGVSTELLVLAPTGSGMMAAASHIHAYLEQSSYVTDVLFVFVMFCHFLNRRTSIIGDPGSG